MSINTSVYCVTLKETPVRNRLAIDHFEKSGVDVTLFRGIHGNTFGLETRYVYNHEPSPHPHVSISSGHIGLILSHYMLWSHLLHSPHEETLILEDDAIIPPDFISSFKLYYQSLPLDWNFCHVGHTGISNKPTKEVNEKILKVDFPFCTHAYLVKKSALSILLDTNHLAWAPLDIQIGVRSFPHLNYYCFKDSLINQRSASGEVDTST